MSTTGDAAKADDKIKSDSKAPTTGLVETPEKEVSEKNLKRFDELKKWYVDQQINNQVKNLGSDGAEPPKMSDSVKPDMSNLFARPDMMLLRKCGWQEESNAMATAAEMAKIEADLMALGVPKEGMALAMWTTARYCASASSSAKMDPKGSDGEAVGNVTRDQIVATIKKTTTLRRVCRLYAPVIWQYMILTETPPEDWQAKGFTEDTKYAAFDFFDFVMNKAAIQPLEGLIRQPTKEEIIANFTHKQIKIDADSGSDRYANLSTEISGGKFGCGVNRKWREQKC